MKIQTKLFLLVAIVSIGFIVVAAMSLSTLTEMTRLSRGLQDGHALIGKVWKLQSATQELMMTDTLSESYERWTSVTDELAASQQRFLNNEAIVEWAAGKEAAKVYDNAKTFFDEINKQIDGFRDGYERTQAEESNRLDSGFYREVFVKKNMKYLFLNNQAEGLIAYLGETTERVVVRLVDLLGDSYATLRDRMTVFYLAVTAGVVLAIGGFILVFTRSIRKRFHGIENAMEVLSQGDFTKNLAVRGRDELASVSRHINAFVDQFSDIIRKIKATAKQTVLLRDELSASTDESAEAVADIAESINTIGGEVERLKETIRSSTEAVGGISTSIDKLAEQIESQSSAVAESSSSIEEMTASIRNVARVAASKQATTDKLISVTRTGGEKVEATDAIVQEITDSVNAMMEIIGIINKIASQTNMLSMNAAIEAAHAGESGRGFSVVAEEIRNLSESTNTNAKKIRESLQEIRSRADDARSLSQESRNYFQDIFTEVDGVTEALREIASTMDELSVGTGEILSSTNELTDTTSVISDTSGAIQERATKIDGSMKEVRSFAEQVSERITSVEYAAREITEAIGQVSEVSKRNSENISQLSEAVDQFEVSETDDLATDEGITTLSAVPESENISANTNPEAAEDETDVSSDDDSTEDEEDRPTPTVPNARTGSASAPAASRKAEQEPENATARTNR
jgi:methyl-accepting chemotaxis protein